jgi:DNA modification methylase
MLLAKEGYRVTKENAHLYAFCDIDLFLTIKSIFTNEGWRVFRTPLVWFKPTAFRAPWPEQGPQRKYEIIFYAVKGARKVNKLFGDVLTYPTDDNLGHQAQKPVALLTDLLSRSYRPGDKVLDPF